ncbi:MAG: alkaline phosphatase [Firmicutes bacterium]|nr:alkaline phosphatase [Bacillota bacterium]
MKNRHVRLAAAILLLMAAFPLASAQGLARNLIIIVVDGMGPAHRQLGELAVKGGLSMNRMSHLGMMDTSSYGSDITDSAAAATAMFTGKRTYNAAIGYDHDLNKLESVMDIASKAGFSCGIATNSELYDATSAAMYANSLTRAEYRNIAKQLMSSSLDLAIGGGARYVDPLIQQSMLSADSKPRFNAYYDLKSLASGGLPAICLLDDAYLQMEIDAGSNAAAFVDIISAALDKLSGKGRPFILLAETGSVDGASHDNDAAAALKGVIAADMGVAKALEFARKDGDTLVLVVSDHETGGLSLGANQGYRIDVPFLARVKSSSMKMAWLAEDKPASLVSIVKASTGYEMSEEEAESIRSSSDWARSIGALISRKANIAWGSGGHTASNVLVTAEGPGSSIFAGRYDNSELFAKMLEALGIRQ